MSQRIVTVEFSSLLRHRLFIDFKGYPRRHIYELGDLHASRTADLIVSTAAEDEGEGRCTAKPV